MDTIKVVCGIIYNGERILLCRRSPNKSLSGYWEFPGGKVENSEKYEDALSRELMEELGMKVKIGQHYMTVVHKYEKLAIELIAYNCQFIEANFMLTDHDSFEWVHAKDINNWNLAPADIPIATKLISKFAVI